MLYNRIKDKKSNIYVLFHELFHHSRSNTLLCIYLFQSVHISLHLHDLSCNLINLYLLLSSLTVSSRLVGLSGLVSPFSGAELSGSVSSSSFSPRIALLTCEKRSSIVHIFVKCNNNPLLINIII